MSKCEMPKLAKQFQVECDAQNVREGIGSTQGGGVGTKQGWKAFIA